MKYELRTRSLNTLLAGTRTVHPEVAFDERGYAPRWEDNLLPGLRLERIARDLATGAGHELDGKLCAAHSSAALAINAFGPWRENPAALHLAGASGFRSLRFEAACPTGCGGTPPHLDLLADGEPPSRSSRSAPNGWRASPPASRRPTTGC